MPPDPNFIFDPLRPLRATKELRGIYPELTLEAAKDAVGRGGSWEDILFRARPLGTPQYFPPTPDLEPQNLRQAMRKRADLAASRGEYAIATEIYKLLLDFTEDTTQDYEV